MGISKYGRNDISAGVTWGIYHQVTGIFSTIIPITHNSVRRSPRGTARTCPPLPLFVRQRAVFLCATPLQADYNGPRAGLHTANV